MMNLRACDYFYSNWSLSIKKTNANLFFNRKSTANILCFLSRITRKATVTRNSIPFSWVIIKKSRK